MCDKPKTFDEIGKFNCNLRLEYIQLLETQLGKSIAEPVIQNAIINKKKQDKEKCLQEKINTYKAEYKASGCGTNPALENCLMLKQYIMGGQQSLALIDGELPIDVANSVIEQNKKKYAESNCDKVFSNTALGLVNNVATKYKGIDKVRIELATKKQVNQRLIFGGFFLVSAIVMFSLLKKKK